MARGCKDTIKKYICMHSDFHCHTKYSDGIDTVEEMIVAAIDIGLRTIAITDHVRKDTKWFDGYVSEIEKLKEKYSGRIKILLGFETKILNVAGGLDAKDDWFGLTDIVLGSCNNDGARSTSNTVISTSSEPLKSPSLAVTLNS